MMSDIDPSNLLLIAKEAALQTGKFLLESNSNILQVDSETGKDIKIRADKESEAIILDYLKRESEFSILSEESGMFEGRDQRLTWIVDPLDGSLNYMRGIPLCCISVGLWQGSSPLLGVVYDFNRSELFTGIVGGEACLNGKSVRVSSIANKNHAVLYTGFPVQTDFSTESLMAFVQKVREYKKVRLLGSAALSLAYVAAGRADAYMENDIRIWDVAAGIALVKASGGVVHYTSTRRENTFGVQASNQSLVS